MKTLIIYTSKTGFAEKYARWILQEVDASIIIGKQADISMIKGYDTIIYIGGVYVGKINGVSKITKNYKDLKDKKIIIVAVGAMGISENAKGEILKNNLPEDMQKSVDFFLLRGGLDYSKMGKLNRFAMNLLVKILKRKGEESLSEQEKLIIKTHGKTLNRTDINSIKPIVEILCNQD